MRLLSRREHSEQELKAKLLSRDVPAACVASVLADLKQRGYLSDRRFTEMFVRSRMQRGQGPVKIRQELCARGVTDDVIEQYLDPSDRMWESVLRKAWSKKFGEAVPGDYKEWAKQARFLQSRGFTAQQIRRVVSFQDQA